MRKGTFEEGYFQDKSTTSATLFTLPAVSLFHAYHPPLALSFSFSLDTHQRQYF